MQVNKIKEIHLLNFQRYKKLVVPLSPKFNCIWGANNEGKSALIRAIEWMFTNAPAGNWMCRVDEDGVVHTAVVKFIFDDGLVLKRAKGKDKNYYAIDENEYHEIGRKIPEEVQEVLGINIVLKDEINILSQIDAQDDLPFLVFAKDTEKARAINLLTGMNIAENAIKDFNSDKMGYSREIGFCNKKIEDLQEKADQFKFLKKLPVKKLKKLRDKLYARQKMFQQFKELSESYDINNQVLVDYKSLREAYGKIDKMELINDNLTTAKTLLIDVIAINQRYNDLKSAVEPPPDVDFDKIQVQVLKMDKKRSTLLKMQHIDIDYDVFEEQVDDYTADEKRLHKKIAGKVCPTCNGKGKL